VIQRRQLRLEWAEHQGKICLKISGWTEPELRELGGLDAGELGRRLALLPSEFLSTGGDFRAVPSIAGHFALEQDSVCFVPRFPFTDGTSYSLLVDGIGAETPDVSAIRRPSRASVPTAKVLAIYPTAAELPVNLLRVYIHFSAPMSEGWAGRSIRVCREDTGEALKGVFLPPEPELWDPERRRLTMLLDPGRIKRGLVPNLEMGYPLIEGVSVRVTVDAEFRDAAGQPLRTGAEQGYRIGPALGSRINSDGWRLTAPPAGTRTPLSVDFDRSLDHGLLQHCLWVRDAAAEALPGMGEPATEERGWRFTPSAPWKATDYWLVIEPLLEDVAGNSTVRVFDRDVTRPEDTPGSGGQITVGFSCVPNATLPS
jgi:hypothetical protein